MSGSSSEEENQKARKREKLNLHEEQYPRNEQLAHILRQMMAKSVKEIRAAYRAEKKKKASGNALSIEVLSSIQRPEDADVSTMMNPRKQHGRKVKNEVVAEKVVCFSLPENCDIGSIKGIDKVQERLGKWRIQRRQRGSKMTDTYYCHLSSRQTFRSIPEAVSFMMFESQPTPSPKKNKGENKTFESTSKKARKNKEKLEDSSHEPYENWINSNLEKSDYHGLEDTYMSESYEELSPEEALKFVGEKTIEEMLLEFEPFNDFHLLISDANEKENGKENSTEMQAQVATGNVEFIMTEANDEDDPKLEDKGSDDLVLQEEAGKENFKPEFETLEQALEKIGNIVLEGIDVVEDHAQHYPELKDLTTDWAANDSLLDDYFDECDLVNHIPTCQSVPELVEFLINNRKK